MALLLRSPLGGVGISRNVMRYAVAPAGAVRFIRYYNNTFRHDVETGFLVLDLL